MEKNVTRRNFLQVTAAAGAVAALAGCDGGQETPDAPSGEQGGSTEAPAADAYPIDAEEWGSGTPKHAEEETRDGWTRVTNEGGTTLGVASTDKLIQVGGGPLVVVANEAHGRVDAVSGVENFIGKGGAVAVSDDIRLPALRKFQRERLIAGFSRHGKHSRVFHR